MTCWLGLCILFFMKPKWTQGQKKMFLEPIGCCDLSLMSSHKAHFQENRKWAGLGRSPNNHHGPFTNPLRIFLFGAIPQICSFLAADLFVLFGWLAWNMNCFLLGPLPTYPTHSMHKLFRYPTHRCTDTQTGWNITFWTFFMTSLGTWRTLAFDKPAMLSSPLLYYC